MLCYSVDSKDSLENVESKWVGEIADNCPGVKLVLVALKCDLREQEAEEEGAEGEAPAAAGQPREKRPTINYDQGLVHTSIAHGRAFKVACRVYPPRHL